MPCNILCVASLPKGVRFHKREHELRSSQEPMMIYQLHNFVAAASNDSTKLSATAFLISPLDWTYGSIEQTSGGGWQMHAHLFLAITLICPPYLRSRQTLAMPLNLVRAGCSQPCYIQDLCLRKRSYLHSSRDNMRKQSPIADQRSIYVAFVQEKIPAQV